MSVPDSRAAGRTVHTSLVTAALVLALGAVLQPAAPDPSIAPIDLAERIRSREPGLVVLDARGEAIDPALAVPGAEPVRLGEAASWPMGGAGDVVVYGLDEAGSRVAAAEARAAGRDGALRLEGGLAGWVSDVMEPVLPPPASALDSAANERIAELSRYFGGRPRVGVDTDLRLPAEIVEDARRRGCGPGR